MTELQNSAGCPFSPGWPATFLAFRRPIPYTWGMPKRSSKRQTDPSEIARQVLDAVVPDVESEEAGQDAAQADAAPKPEKNPAAVALGRLGRLGGLKGGKARAAKLTKKERSEIARKAAKARWSKHDP